MMALPRNHAKRLPISIVLLASLACGFSFPISTFAQVRYNRKEPTNTETRRPKVIRGKTSPWRIASPASNTGGGNSFNWLASDCQGGVWIVGQVMEERLLVHPAPAGSDLEGSFPLTARKSRTITYRVGKSLRTVQGPKTLVVYISVDPRYFNQEDMVLLASQLKERFAAEPRLSVWIFDSYSSARSFIPHPHSPTYTRDYDSLRGFYDLDRDKSTEKIRFSSSSGRPRDEIKIDLLARN